MTNKIRLVSGDTRPFIKITLTNKDSTPINVADPATTVRVFFRRVGEATILTTITCTKPSGGADGVVQFSFPPGALDIPAGLYEGEIEIDFDGEKQTVYQPLKFSVREQFA